MSHASRRHGRALQHALALPALVVMLVSVLTTSLLVGVETAEAASYKAPTSLKTVSTSQTAARLTWKAVSKATSYRVKFDDNARMSSPAMATSSTTSVELKGLKPGTKYWANVVVVNSKGKTLGKFSRTVSFSTQPKGGYTQLAPASAKVTSTAATALRMTWSTVPGATRYRVKYSTSSKMSSPGYAYSTSTSVEITRLRAGATYYLQVSSVTAQGSNLSQYTVKVKAKTRPKNSVPLLSPTGLKASGITVVGGTLSWAARGSTNRYQLRYSTSSSFSKPGWATATGTSRTLSGLKPSTRYYVQVKVVDAAGKDVSEYSPAISFVTAKLVIKAPPTGLRVTKASPTSLTLQWTAIPGAPGYRLKYDPKPWNSSKYVFTTANTITVSGLLKNTRYSFKVRVMKPDGTTLSDYGATVTATTPVSGTTAPSAPVKVPDTPPSGLKASISGTAVVLSWNAIAGAPQYRVKYDVDPWNTPIYANSVANSLTLNGLTPGVTYSFKVRVMDAVGEFLTDYGTTVTVSVPRRPTPVIAASYNVRCHNCSSGIAEEKPWTTRRTAIIETINSEGPDVIGLQEAQQSWLLDSNGDTINKSQFEDLVERLGGVWKLTNPARNNCVKSTTPTDCVYKDQGASKGTKIIYRTDRLKLISSGTVELSALTSSSYDRYLAWAVFEQLSTGKQFFFGDTHLEPDNDKVGQTIYHDQRARQAQDILRIIAAKNTGKLPVVLVGDLASSRADEPTNAPYDVLTKGGLIDPLGNVKGVTQPVNPTVQTRINTNYYSFNGWARTARKTTSQVNGIYNDYILTSPGTTVAEFENVVKVDSAGKFVGVIPSDHNMVRATLWLPGVTPTA